MVLGALLTCVGARRLCAVDAEARQEHRSGRGGRCRSRCLRGALRSEAFWLRRVASLG